MVRVRVKFTYPAELIKQPVIYTLATTYGLITNIRRAEVGETSGWVILELTGPEEDLERALAAMRDLGIRVDPVEGDLFEG
ncbi:MAG: NIL domain-containing protein [Chloroflexi bacterium]|nr:NIL domain-containing protein [Chloroflexota bacterium]